MADKKWLTARWFRYALMPIAAGLPSGAAALWFALHAGVKDEYYLRDYQPEIFAITGTWALLLSILKSYLTDFAKTTIETLENTIIDLKRGQEELVHLFNFVRIVVGAKSKRFFDVSRNLTPESNPGETFFRITRPDLQIKQLIESIHGFYRVNADPTEERIRVSLMRPDGGQLVFTQWFPDGDTPSSLMERFDGTTLAGLAFLTKQIVISESVEADVRYRHFGARRDQGSMFSYPLIDAQLGEVIYVANVTSTKIGRFADTPKQRAKIESTMEIFAERIILENRLALIKERMSTQVGG